MIKYFFKCDRKGSHLFLIYKGLVEIISQKATLYPKKITFLSFLDTKTIYNSNKNRTFARLFKQLFKNGTI